MRAEPVYVVTRPRLQEPRMNDSKSQRRSKCCDARVTGSLADGVLVGWCEKCGASVCKLGAGGQIIELDGGSPWGAPPAPTPEVQP